MNLNRRNQLFVRNRLKRLIRVKTQVISLTIHHSETGGVDVTQFEHASINPLPAGE